MHMHPLIFAVLSALVSQILCTPLDATVDIPEYDISRRHQPDHHDEIGIPAHDLLDHLHENYPHRNFIRKRTTGPHNTTVIHYDIPDDLMDLAVRSFPIQKRRENVLKRRELMKRAVTEPPTGPLPAGAGQLEKRGFGLTAFRYSKVCGGGSGMSNDKFNDAVRFFCTQHNDYMRDFLADGGAEPPPYVRAGPWELMDDSEGDAVFVFSHDPNFPWQNLAWRCDSARDLNNCGGDNISNGGKVTWISRVGDGAASYGLLIGDSSPFMPFNTG